MAKFTQLFKEIQDNSITPIKTTFCGDLESLETTTKDNLVNAINEVKNSSGGMELLWSGNISSSSESKTITIDNLLTYKEIILDFNTNYYANKISIEYINMDYVNYILNNNSSVDLYFVLGSSGSADDRVVIQNIKIYNNNRIEFGTTSPLLNGYSIFGVQLRSIYGIK